MYTEEYSFLDFANFFCVCMPRNFNVLLTFNFIYHIFCHISYSCSCQCFKYLYFTQIIVYTQEFQSAHVHNNLSNFQKADGVAVMTGQLAQYGSGLTNPAGGYPVFTVNSICFLNITVFVMYMCTWFGFFVFSFLVFILGGCQSVRDGTAQAGASIFKMLGFIIV